MKKQTRSLAIILVILLLMQSIGIAPIQTHVVYADTQIDIQPPTSPTNLSSTSITATTVDLSWDTSTDDIAVTGYDVYIGVTMVGTVDGTTYAAIGLTPDTIYNFSVKAKDAAGNLYIYC